MPSKGEIRREAERLLSVFQDAGAEVLETNILQPAGAFLDLYGEDIRARALVTNDPELGELMLRPDFTVPVVQQHMENGVVPARYAYAGKVFRRQEIDANRDSEFYQVGYEVFERENPAAADAEVFTRISGVFADDNVKATIGDIGILMAAVDGLSTAQRRKDALRRHIWRPHRFRALLDRFSNQSDTKNRSFPVHDRDLSPHIGLRSREEIAQRIRALKEDQSEPPISQIEVDTLNAILGLNCSAHDGLARLSEIANDMPAVSNAVSRFARRLDALDERGCDVSDLAFEASHGRTSMEYYDGFVFAFQSVDNPDLPPLATGGRYDALTNVIGAGKSIPAVGGVIRPEFLLEMREASE